MTLPAASVWSALEQVENTAMTVTCGSPACCMQPKEPAARRARPRLRRGAPPARAAGPRRGAGRGRARQRSGRGRARRGRWRTARRRVRAGPSCAPRGGLVDVHAQYHRHAPLLQCINIRGNNFALSVAEAPDAQELLSQHQRVFWGLSFCAAAPLRPRGASRACLAATLAQPGRRAHAAGSLAGPRCHAEPS